MFRYNASRIVPLNLEFITLPLSLLHLSLSFSPSVSLSICLSLCVCVSPPLSLSVALSLPPPPPPPPLPPLYLLLSSFCLFLSVCPCQEGETVQIGVNHPSPESPDLDSASSSFSPGGTIQQLMQGALHWGGEDSDEDDEDDEDDEEGDNNGKRSTLTPVSNGFQHTILSHTREKYMYVFIKRFFQVVVNS